MAYDWAIPGAKVICIVPDGIAGKTLPHIRYRQILTIRNLFIGKGSDDNSIVKAVRFEEIQGPIDDYGFEVGYGLVGHFIQYEDKPLSTYLTRLLNTKAPIIPQGGHLDRGAIKSKR